MRLFKEAVEANFFSEASKHILCCFEGVRNEADRTLIKGLILRVFREARNFGVHNALNIHCSMLLSASLAESIFFDEFKALLTNAQNPDVSMRKVLDRRYIRVSADIRRVRECIDGMPVVYPIRQQS